MRRDKESVVIDEEKYNLFLKELREHTDSLTALFFYRLDMAAQKDKKPDYTYIVDFLQRNTWMFQRATPLPSYYPLRLNSWERKVLKDCYTQCFLSKKEEELLNRRDLSKQLAKTGIGISAAAKVCAHFVNQPEYRAAYLKDQVYNLCDLIAYGDHITDGERKELGNAVNDVLNLSPSKKLDIIGADQKTVNTLAATIYRHYPNQPDAFEPFFAELKKRMGKNSALDKYKHPVPHAHMAYEDFNNASNIFLALAILGIGIAGDAEIKLHCTHSDKRQKTEFSHNWATAQLISELEPQLIKSAEAMFPQVTITRL